MKESTKCSKDKCMFCFSLRHSGWIKTLAFGIEHIDKTQWNLSAVKYFAYKALAILENNGCCSHHSMIKKTMYRAIETEPFLWPKKGGGA